MGGALSVSVRVAILALGIAAGAALVATSPATNRTVRIADPWGDWRRVTAASLFDLAAYRRDTAIGFLGMAATTEDFSFAERAQALLLSSLEHAPGDAFSWMLLAWSEAFLSRTDHALEALGNSWALAPHSEPLARERLTLVALLEDEPRARGHAAPIERDLAVLLRTRAGHRHVEELAQQSDFLRQLARLQLDAPLSRDDLNP